MGMNLLAFENEGNRRNVKAEEDTDSLLAGIGRKWNEREN